MGMTAIRMGRPVGRIRYGVYTVHEPPLKKHETAPDAGSLRLRARRLHSWAFLFGPLWMLRHRLWLVLLCYVLIAGALTIILRTVGASGNVGMAVGFLIAFLMGCEAGTLRRWTLTRRGFRAVGLVVGDDQEAPSGVSSRAGSTARGSRPRSCRRSSRTCRRRCRP